MNPFKHHSRGSMTAQRIARIFAMRDGKCGIPKLSGDPELTVSWSDGCGWKFGVKSDYEVDHILALEKGGTDEDENLQLLCPSCHAKKTGSDHSEAGHMRRSYTAMVVPKRFRKGHWWRT